MSFSVQHLVCEAYSVVGVWRLEMYCTNMNNAKGVFNEYAEEVQDAFKDSWTNFII
jgi:hypothetical protein